MFWVLIGIPNLLYSQFYIDSISSITPPTGSTVSPFVNGVAKVIEKQFIGDGFLVSNVNFIGHKKSIGFFQNGLSTALGMDEGILLSTGHVIDARGPNNNEGVTGKMGTGGLSVFDTLAAGPTFDGVQVQFDFVPQTDQVEFNYVFASDEYIEYVDKKVSDIFGFFISGPGINGLQNVALVPETSITVSIDNLNHLRNTKYFKINPINDKLLQMDGFTVKLSASLKLLPCEKYTIKLALADVGDEFLDSWVFLESKSFKHKTLLGKDTTICNNGNFEVEMDAGNPQYKVKWSTGDTTQKIRVNNVGNYWVDIFTNCGKFRDHKSILLGVTDFSLGNDTFFCGDSFDTELSIKNRSFQSYKWSTTETTPTIKVNTPGKYTLEVYKNGCYKSDTIHLDLFPYPPKSLPKDTHICGKIDFQIQLNNPSIKYKWHNGDTNMLYNITKSGTYILENNNGHCITKDTFNVINRDIPSINIGPPVVKICMGDSVFLKTGLKDTNIYAHRWSNGFKKSSFKTNIPGIYSVVVKDKKCGFVVSDSTEILAVEGNDRVWIANAFTPNFDNLNEIFIPIKDFDDVKYYQFTIYNRWGEMMFETDDPNKGWDGTFNGKPAEMGMYIWLLTLKTNCTNTKYFSHKGTIFISK